MHCPKCKLYGISEHICGVCGSITEASATVASATVPTPISDKASKIEIGQDRKNAGVMMLAGAFLVALGTLLPWFRVSSGIFSVQRNAFQFGQNLSMTLAPGPIILVMALVMAYDGLRLVGIFGGGKESFARPTVSTVIAGVDVFAGMTSTFSANGGVAASLSFGPLISILGVIAGLGAVVLMYREWQAGSKSGNPGKEIGLSLLGAILVGIILSSF